MRPTLHLLDWTVIAAYGVFVLATGVFFAKKASKDVDSFFVGDRKLPWWIAGTSIVATTFAADTPLAVTGIIASDGISGNWIWWAWAIAHLIATFLFAAMWRRSGVITDAEITELRYSGPAAAKLRVIKALYFGIFINCLTMAWVIAAMVKISQAFFDVPAWQVIIACVAVAVAYTILGGFQSVVITDLLQFALGMLGAIVLAVIVVMHFGGMGTTAGDAGASSDTGLLGAVAQSARNTGHALEDTLNFIPAVDHPTMPLVAFLVLLGFGWWRYAEGNGYVVQRLAACKNEAHAEASSLWFAIAHNALRPWPWIVVGLAALVVYPRVSGEIPKELIAGDTTIKPASIDVATGGTLTIKGGKPGDVLSVAEQSVPFISDGQAWTATFGPFKESGTPHAIITSQEGVRRDLGALTVTLLDREMAYPLMMGQFLPVGLLGLVIASLLAAFMSTIDTHTNWGASYLIQDVYRRFVAPDASEARCVLLSRWCVVGIAVVAGLTALIIANIAEVWRFLITLGAGLGSVTAARWYWSRVTPHAELAALAVTTVVAVVFQMFFTATLFGGPNPFFVVDIPSWAQILIVAGSSLAAWVPVALFGPSNPPETLQAFAAKVRPSGPGWRDVASSSQTPLWPAILKVIGGCGLVYGSLFGIGHLLLGRYLEGVAWLLMASLLLFVVLRRAVPNPATPP
ncbi:MAG: hypothetical protein A2289_15000 [Deltaproteobacteria bacterium RIFOXYA12_FULL_58_15]|nr:MAG: hypothetical protein A2289_15000 [Deltaproteobacteria bacterium RIFOXYA12_FULL_58_15]OGR12256.1 MAG: hypothetical protein A2341_26040 [Deltaproteobacteria bacterium RIFOXYB12_FULL_58_9]